jgi:hypothetical protein
MTMSETQRDQLRDQLFTKLNKFMGNSDDGRMPDGIDPDMLMHFGQYNGSDPELAHGDRPRFSFWREGIGAYPVIFASYDDLLNWVNGDMDDDEYLHFSEATKHAVGISTTELWACALTPRRTPMPFKITPLQNAAGHHYCVIYFSLQS